MSSCPCIICISFVLNFRESILQPCGCSTDDSSNGSAEPPTGFPVDLIHNTDFAGIQTNKGTQTVEMIPDPRKCSFLKKVKTEAQLTSCTGLDTFEGFRSLCDAVEFYCEKRLEKEDTYALDVEARVFLTLMKLKLNPSYVFMTIIFGVSSTTCSKYFKETLSILSQLLKCFIPWPDRDSVKLNIPKYFLEKYSDVRTVFDCTEVPVYSPPCILCRTQLYSHYYQRHTVKFMTGVTPSGIITFCSPAYGGRASDKYIFENSGKYTITFKLLTL